VTMKKYLSAILVFDVLLPALLLGVPGCILLWALFSFQQYAETKTTEFSAHQDRVRQVEGLKKELQPVEAKAPLLKGLLSNKDIESRVDRSILSALDKFSPDEIDRMLHDSQYGPSPIGQALEEGHRLSLKFASRWEPLTAAALDWETNCPNLLLETLSISRSAGVQTSQPHLDSALSYFVVTEN
jgi:hypothetical protein